MKHNISSVILTVCVLFCACSQNPATDSCDFVFSTENIAGDEAYYSKPAVITGHIANRDVYPNVTEIGITIPFYDMALSLTSANICVHQSLRQGRLLRSIWSK